MVQTFRPPASKRIYDVCVVGSQLGGVVAGALLARRGFRVLHVAHDDPGFAYVDHGYLLPFGPAVFPSPRQLPSAETVLQELGLTTDVSRALAPSSPDLQLLLPRHRVDLSRDAAALKTELDREWPKDAAALEAEFATLATLFEFAGFFLRAAPPLPPDGMLDRREVKKAIKLASTAPGAPPDPVGAARPFVRFEDHELVQSVLVAHRFLTYLDGAPSPLSIVRLLGGAFQGTNRLPGGLGTLREMVRRRIAESRGELRGGPGEPALASAFELDGGKVEAVRLADSPNAHVARAFIVATDADRLLSLLPPDARDARVADPLRAIRPRRQLLTLNLIVRDTALPPALGDNVLALRSGHGGDGLDNAVFLQVLQARRAGTRGVNERGVGGDPVPGERVVCACGFIPAEVRSREALKEAATRIREAVADAIPFFEGHLVAESAPLVAAPDRADLSPVHPLYETQLEETLGVTGLPVRGPWKNLFFAGREVLPGLGIEGEFYAGIQAAGHAAALLGGRNPLK